MQGLKVSWFGRHWALGISLGDEEPYRLVNRGDSGIWWESIQRRSEELGEEDTCSKYGRAIQIFKYRNNYPPK